MAVEKSSSLEVHSRTQTGRNDLVEDPSHAAQALPKLRHKRVLCRLANPLDACIISPASNKKPGLRILQQRGKNRNILTPPKSIGGLKSLVRQISQKSGDEEK
jgi:hypothetical protein